MRNFFGRRRPRRSRTVHRRTSYASMETALGCCSWSYWSSYCCDWWGCYKGGPFSTTGEPGAAGATDALLWSRPGVFAVSGEKDLPKKF